MTYSKRYSFILALIIIAFFIFPVPSEAQTDMFSGLSDSPNQTLNITSDKFLSDRKSQYVQFMGNVTAVYGNSTITSDKLKVMYLDTPKSPSLSNEGKIDKIIATGHVTIKFDDKTAYCDQAVYTTETQTIQLTGKDSRIQSDDNYITGEKITIRQLSGQIIVDGNSENRVNAVFKPEKNSSNFPETQTNDKPK